jgi:RimJ/RimL family protein N-acetyltransferase
MLEQTTLTGRVVALEPIEERHREALRAAAGDGAAYWPYLPLKGDFDATFDTWLTAQAKGERLPFVVRLLADGRVVGSTCYLNISARDRRLEIGGTWYHPSVWAGAVNPECKRLLLAEAFGPWAANRVEFRSDARNARSRAAIARLGAVEEAVLRQHMYAPDGHLRDTVVFAILRADWPTVRDGLDRRLAPAIGKTAGEQAA